MNILPNIYLNINMNTFLKIFMNIHILMKIPLMIFLNIQLMKDNKFPIYPCLFDNVICVGAIDNAGLNGLYKYEREIENLRLLIINGNFSKKILDRIMELTEIYKVESAKILDVYSNKIMNPEHYRVASFSNYGKKVDIYAPGHVEIEYRDVNGVDQKKVVSGTSFSSPMVAGIVATIMSENPDVQFDKKKMIEYLTEMGEKNIIEGILEGNPNIFINNGKHSIYPGDIDEEIDLIDEETSNIINFDDLDDLDDKDIYIEAETDGYIIDE
eukprot:jgi/Orpsp1_1/1189459/evm.model.d7180000072208.1